MPITLLQSTKSAAAALNLAYTSNNTAGSLLICVVFDSSSGLAGVPTDTQGNTWQDAVDVSGNYAIYYAENCKAGANTVQTGIGSTTGLMITIYEFSGVATSGSLDVANSSASGINAGTTTTGNGDLVFATGEAFNNTGGPNPTVSTSAGWTAGQTVAIHSGAFITTRDGWQVQTSAGAIDISSWTTSGGNPDESLIAAFFKAGAVVTNHNLLAMLGCGT